MNDFIFLELETNSLPPGSNSTWIYSYLFLSSGCNPWSTYLANTTPPRFVTINNSMRCVWQICFLSVDQTLNKSNVNKLPLQTWKLVCFIHLLILLILQNDITNRVLQPMLILTNLSWCHKFQLHFMSLMTQIKVMFIKIECSKTKPSAYQKRMERVNESNIT